jgi:hypothetical protein
MPAICTVVEAEQYIKSAKVDELEALLTSICQFDMSPKQLHAGVGNVYERGTRTEWGG